MSLAQTTDIQDEKNRIVRGWGTVDIRDLDNEVLPMDEFRKIMPIIMKRGGIIQDSHTNKNCGKIINFEIKNNPEVNREGLLLTYQIYDDTELDNRVWEEIKSNKRKGLSFGGAAKGTPKIKIDLEKYGGDPVKILSQLEGYEFSSVFEPCNPEALNTEVNYFAKGKDVKKPFAGYKDFDSCVAQNQDKKDANAYCATIMRAVEDTDKMFTNKEESEGSNKRDENNNTTNSINSKKGDMLMEDNEEEKKKQEDEKKPEEEEKKKETDEKPDNDKLDRIISSQDNLEKAITKLADVLTAKQETDAGIPKAKEAEEDEKKPDEEEKKKEGEGEKVVLPKVPQEEEDAKPKEDTIQVMEKMREEIKELKKSISAQHTATVPRTPHTETANMTPVDKQKKSLETIEKMRNGQKPDFNQVREDIIKDRSEQIKKALSV